MATHATARSVNLTHSNGLVDHAASPGHCAGPGALNPGTNVSPQAAPHTPKGTPRAANAGLYSDCIDSLAGDDAF